MIFPRNVKLGMGHFEVPVAEGDANQEPWFCLPGLFLMHWDFLISIFGLVFLFLHKGYSLAHPVMSCWRICSSLCAARCPEANKSIPQEYSPGF